MSTLVLIAPQEVALDELQRQLAAERARADAERARADKLAVDYAKLLEAYQQLDLELKLLKKRIQVATAERVDTTQLQMEFAHKEAELAGLAAKLDGATLPAEPAQDATNPSTPGNGAEPARSGASPNPPAPPENKNKPKPKGRRNLSTLPLEEQRVEVLDPLLEGEAERIGFEESYKLGWITGHNVRIVMARAKYRVTTQEGAPTIATAPLPPAALDRCLAAPSLLAKIAVDKYCDGLPLHRIEQRFERDEVRVDRGTMSRWMEDVGMTLGAIVVAMKKEAFETSFCISTDATGVCIQPEASPTGARQPCRRGHFLVQLADRDHALFEFLPHETSEAIKKVFAGYSGYVQADAKSTYDILFSPKRDAQSDDGCEAAPCTEVGCWSHARRKFYDAAICKDATAREALWWIHKLFKLEEGWKKEPPAKRTALREKHSRPIVDAFFKWAEAEHEKVEKTRGLLRTALGYVVRQREPLRRFLTDGRLKIDNNASERALRHIAVGRNAWLFFGSDDHAEAAGNLFSLIMSCRLHGQNPESYLRDVLRALAHWPKERYLELAPRYWKETRARLDPRELELPFGALMVPDAAAKEAAAG